MDTKKLLLSAALGGLIAGYGCASKENAPAGASGGTTMGECHGANACKGKGECGGKGQSHGCAGKNACKGKGWTKTDEATCKTKKGKFRKG